jgi:FAD dependent oxidoreductase
MTMERTTEILIVGGGVGGVAAALAAVQLGRDVILTEETDWIGGQLTAQAVPPDEHPWIEETGCTRTYRLFRDGVRRFYRSQYPLVPEARDDPHLNPGRGWVSGLCHEPRVALAVLREMLAVHRSSGRLHVLTRHRPCAVETDGDRIGGVMLQDLDGNDVSFIRARYVLDATETGEVIDLGAVEHVIGSESQEQTGEPHALAGTAEPLAQQAVTWCFALDYLPREDHTISAPRDYGFWRRYRADFWPGPQLGWVTPDPETLQPRYRPLFADRPGDGIPRDLWCFRRILYREHFTKGAFPSDVSLVNWPQVDYWLKPIVGVPPEVADRALVEARQLSLSMLHWMQTEAPRPDGGTGYPGLRLRADIVGTEHGLAKNVYVRESRRIKSQFTILEQHVGVEARGGLVGAERFDDSVGTGAYRLDLHPTTAGRNYVDIPNWPFQIPLGALIPVRVENMLPAAKNIGTTHITNGCYRLHPVEWNVGEAAGALVAHCCRENLLPRQVREEHRHLREFQRLLRDGLGIELSWKRSVARTAID